MASTSRAKTLVPTLQHQCRVGAALRVLSHNLAGGTLFISELLRRFKPDILCLQEVKIATKELNSIVNKSSYIGESNLCPVSPHKPGTAMVWKADLPVMDQVSSIVEERRVQLLRMAEGGVAIMNVYAPSGTATKSEREALFAGEMALALRGLGPRVEVVLAGDWNCVLNARDVERNYRLKCSDSLAALVDTYKLTDVFSFLYPGRIEYTFQRASVTRSRLDRVYVSPGLVTSLKEVWHEPGLSDHAVLVTDLLLHEEVQQGEEGEETEERAAPKQEPKAGVWRLNCSILQDDVFLALAKGMWEQVREEQVQFDDLADWWEEEAKPALRGLCMAFSSRAAAERREMKEMVVGQLKSALESQRWGLVAQFKEQLRQLLLYEQQGVVIRSRHQQEAEEEQAGIYHIGKELRNAAKNGPEKLKVRTEEGEYEVVEEQDKIEEALFKFNEALFNSRLDSDLKDTGSVLMPSLHLHQDEFLRDLPKISQYSREKLTAKLCLEEVKDCLGQMENGKSPGEDGLPKELYTALWELIGEDLLGMLQAVLDRLLLPESCTRGLTRLISKVLPPRIPEVTDMRPVTLLNTDYKLLSRILTRRTRLVLPEVILSRQLATPGRDIMEGVHCLLSTMAFIERRFQEGGRYAALLALYDMVKAFDRTHVAYLDLVLDQMNFPEQFRSWILMLHRGATTRLIFKDGRLSDLIRIKVSERQGDPWAMTGYILQFEPFLRALEKAVTGVTLGLPRVNMMPNPTSHTEKGPAFADDYGIITTNEQDLLTVDQVSRRYEEQSGALLSRNKKSKVIFLGAWRDQARRPPLPITYLREVEETKVFGFWISHSVKQTIRRTWEERIRMMRGKFMQWRTRELPTLHQRSQVVNTYLVSTIWYTAQVIPLPPSFRKQINTEVSRFLFRGRLTMGRLTLAELCHPVKAGGLGMVDTQRKADTLLLRQTCRMVGRKEAGYRHLSYWLSSRLGDRISLDEGPRSLSRPPKLQQHILELVTEAREKLSEQDLLAQTARMLYQKAVEDLPAPRLQRRNPGLEMAPVWERLSSPVLGAQERHALFILANCIVRNKENIFLRWGQGDYTCDCDPDPEGKCAGQPQSIRHMFQDCTRVAGAWDWLYGYLSSCLPPAILTEGDCVTLLYPRLNSQLMEDSVIWLLGTYQVMVTEVIEKRRVVGEQELRGYLRQKYEAYKMKRMRPLVESTFTFPIKREWQEKRGGKLLDTFCSIENVATCDSSTKLNDKGPLP